MGSRQQTWPAAYGRSRKHSESCATPGGFNTAAGTDLQARDIIATGYPSFNNLRTNLQVKYSRKDCRTCRGLLPRLHLEELSLQRSAMHPQSARCLGDIAAAVG